MILSIIILFEPTAVKAEILFKGKSKYWNRVHASNTNCIKLSIFNTFCDVFSRKS